MVFVVAFVFVFIIVKFDSLPSNIETIKKMNGSELDTFYRDDPIEISNILLSKLVENEYRDLFYIEHEVIQRVVFNGNYVTYFQASPLTDRFGYLVNFDIHDETIPYDRQVILYIEDMETREPKEIYYGSYKTSGWEWFSDDEVLVLYNCGTECQLLYLININSGKKQKLLYGVGYEWSPNKEMVLAYHYSGRFGITVGDKFGNVVFEFLREYLGAYVRLLDQTKVLWSPDSSKIALMIKKEKQEVLELIVFDVKQDFKQIFQQDLVGESEDIEFYWQDDSMLFYKDLREEHEIIF